MTEIRGESFSGMHIEHSTITVDVKPKYDEHLAASIESLSKAIVANADAIKAVTQMAQNSVPRNVYGICIGRSES